ncbi:MAG: hypothetical protein ACFNYQ_09285, partial [Treponema sp.]|uniref:hypothetical protein n=1 Tax=Treponema sp. TaxID=166 RepID=UPI00361F7507
MNAYICHWGKAKSRLGKQFSDACRNFVGFLSAFFSLLVAYCLELIITINEVLSLLYSNIPLDVLLSCLHEIIRRFQSIYRLQANSRLFSFKIPSIIRWNIGYS